MKNASHDRRFALMEQLVLQETGVPLRNLRPVPLSIDEAAKSLWPINKRLKPNLEQISALPYDKRFESQADAAVSALALAGDEWLELPAPVWRVLLERQIQCLELLALKAAEAGSWQAPFMSAPDGIPAPLRQRLAVLFLLFETPLPFPISDRVGSALPSGAVVGTLTRQ